MAQQQKMLLYFMPVMFAFSGINFPIGVLIYWTTTNIWSMGQQFYTIRRMPAPGSQAEAALKARQARKGIPIGEQGGGARGGTATAVIEERPKSGQRQQPVRKDRAKKPAPTKAPGSSDAGKSVAAPSAPDGGGAAALDQTPTVLDKERGERSGRATAEPTTSVAGDGPRKPRRPSKSGSATKPGGATGGRAKGDGSKDPAGDEPTQ
jgi:YidC/Oxa1 family membrane protein insertase